jgi:hypothetical protein
MATKARPTKPATRLTTRPEPPRPTLAALMPSAQVPGRDVTVADFIVEQITAGVDPINAAGVCGVTPAEFQAWVREGTLVFSRLNAGSDWRRDFTAEQQDCALFAEAVVRARARHIASLAVIAEQVARGGVEQKTTRRKIVGGQTVEEHTITTRTLPDPRMLQWKLEKLEPAVYGSQATLNVTVSDLTDTDVVADVVGQRMRDVAAKLAAAIETTGTEVVDGHGE